MAITERVQQLKRPRLPVGSVILLDDTARAGEAEALRRWTEEAKMEVALHDEANGSFAVITRN